MNAKIVFLVFFIAAVLSSCKEELEIQDVIKVEIETIEKLDSSVYIESKVNMLSNQITDHGHYWSNREDLTMDSDSILYTCHGPLINSQKFTDQIILGEGTFYIGSYIIVNEYLIYNESRKITIQLN